MDINRIYTGHVILGTKDLSKPESQVISLEEWLGHWGKLLHDARNVSDFPVWLQYLPKIIYQAINSSGKIMVILFQFRSRIKLIILVIQYRQIEYHKIMKVNSQCTKSFK